MVRMLYVGTYSVDTRVWIAVIPCGGDGVLVGNECYRCRDIIQASRWLRLSTTALTLLSARSFPSLPTCAGIRWTLTVFWTLAAHNRVQMVEQVESDWRAGPEARRRTSDWESVRTRVSWNVL